MNKIFLFCSFLFLFNTMNCQVKIIAHRGASYLAPENTVASVGLAWELGADAVEVDVYLSKDNRIMCIHDADTKRTTGKYFKISETDSEILRQLDAGSLKDKKYSGERIPYIEEVINKVPEGKTLVIEIKCGSEILPFLKAAIAENGSARNFNFIAFDLQTITNTKAAFPDNPCHWLCSNRLLIETNLASIHGRGLDGVSLSHNIIDNKVAEKIIQMNLDLYTWTVDDAQEAQRLISLGIKGITTNRPDWLREQLDR